MLATRVLPPILRSPSQQPAPTAYFNIPRVHERSPMVEMSDGPHGLDHDNKQARHLRKTSKTMITRSVSSPSPGRRLRSASGSSPHEHEAPGRATRKRASSLNYPEEDQENSPEADSPPAANISYSAPTTGSGELSQHVCLCQPEPKIPRPRNAFILYRQHHQHAVVAHNPGLANPEISKIIGEKWRAEEDEVKRYWQGLADKEKARHHEQYPDYRYQPRRTGRPGALPINPSGEHTTFDKYRCPRCGGRNIRTPTSPYPLSQPTPTLPPPNSSPNTTPTTRFLPLMNNLSLDSPHARRGRPGPSSLSNIQVPTSGVDEGMYSPLSPDSKRRRYNAGVYTASSRRLDGAPYYTGHSRRDSLPPIRQSPPNTATMPPPRTPGKASGDLSLSVPPSHDQSRSVEAMVMSVPYQVKIKVLGRITPPLKDPGPTSPAWTVRGAILAVEGEDTTAVQELSHWLEDFLHKDKEYQPKIAEPPKAPEEEKEVSFLDYLDLMREWHSKSNEMIGYITTPIDPKLEGGDASASNPSNIKPVVILPTYQLHASDVYTSRIQIQDAYSPMDHWQWMATMWRGTVGPDLTIYVKDVKGEEMAGGKFVEVNEEVRCLTIKREKGTTKFEESALRRVGFEVSEWIRGIGNKNTH